jgi:hypothetical protein
VLRAGPPLGAAGDRTWSEWRWDGLIQWMRLYVEPVEKDSAAIEEVVQELSGSGS